MLISLAIIFFTWLLWIFGVYCTSTWILTLIFLLVYNGTWIFWQCTESIHCSLKYIDSLKTQFCKFMKIGFLIQLIFYSVLKFSFYSPILNYSYSNMTLGVILLLCLFISVLVVHFPLGNMTYLVLYSWLPNSVRYGFQVMESASHPIKNWLVTPITFVPLLHNWVCIAGKLLL